MKRKANRGRRLRAFSPDANQRLDLRAGQALGTWLSLADLGNLLSIIPPSSPDAPNSAPRQPGNPFHLIHTLSERTAPYKVHILHSRE